MNALDERLTEAQFQRRVTDYATLRGWRWYHTHRSDRSPAGYPDLTLVRGRRLMFVELKSQRGKPTEEQKQWLFALGLCAEVYLWRPSDWPNVQMVLR